ncbi:GLPGLI family protein [Psychroserpens burtonensis]|uniref:GLPGLI family protein n=1 Tax=Psychroserpens burtonensis TaxID=49278 RepID=A0A5C7BA72_9FLAO|nr:GLPGLI family protein [Psychroserpens burtonensis]TXE17649.1 GLPGLI family protein [Psychroserpens burtonensis]
MKFILTTFTALFFIGLMIINPSTSTNSNNPQDAKEFQGQAVYMAKSSIDFGAWGARMSEEQKKAMKAQLKNRLEKTYTLTFNKSESYFTEEEKLDAMSGATDSWGKNFAAGDQYKNVKTNTQIQDQEFYGKRFLVKDSLQPIDWKLGSESKQIGSYMCFKATASIPTDELTWYSFSWPNSAPAANTATGETIEPEIAMTEVEAWYSPQIPVSHGPSEYWGLPGLILEVSAGDTTMLCSKLVINPEETIEIEAPDKGKEINKKDYQATLVEKMKEFRSQRMGGRRG